jgi:hypothetical protein
MILASCRAYVDVKELVLSLVDLAEGPASDGKEVAWRSTFI